MMELLRSVGSHLEALFGPGLSYWAAFAGGVAISFTPCTYPVLPIVAGYVGSRGGGSRARSFFLSLAYVAGMAAVYAALGLLAALTGRVFGTVAASPAAKIVVANVCLLMGLSLLDVFTLRLPGLSSRPSAGRPSGGAGGAFAAGAASGLVVGPCTAPVLGALLVYAGSRGNAAHGGLLLFAFAFGMGTLPILLGTFSGMLACLPRSGKWLDAVKKGFALILLLAGEYFLIEAGRLMG